MRRTFVRSLSKLLILSLAMGLTASFGPTEQVAAEEATAADAGQSLRHSAWDAADTVPGKVLVKYANTPRSNRMANSIQSKTISPKLVELTFEAGTDIEAKIEELQQDPDVEYAEPVFKTYLIEPVEDAGETVTQSVYSGPETYMKLWGQHATELFDVADETTSEEREGVIVAVLDTGIDAYHPDLSNSILDGYDFINSEADTFDGNGHGTHVAGIIGAVGTDADGYTGIAPGVKLLPVQVLDENGSGDTQLLVDAIGYAVNAGADIINMSLGSPAYSRAVHEAIIDATEAGVLVIAASGNESNHWLPGEAAQLGEQEGLEDLRYGMLTGYPALLDEVVSVGAIAQLEDGSYAIADFSNPGRVDFVAPGVRIYSTLPGGNHGYQSGTSQAAPIAAGYAALLKANNPALTGYDLRSALTGSASLAGLAELETIGHEGVLFPTQEGLFAFDRPIDREITYGTGLINANEMFTDAFLRMQVVEEDLSGTGTVTMDVYLTNVDGEKVAENVTVELHARSYDESSPFRADDMLAGGPQSLTLVDGYGRGTLSIGTPTDVYKYYMYAAMAEAGEAPLRVSNSSWFYRYPEVPSANLASGTYIGERAIALTSGTAGAVIEYYYEPSDGSGDMQGSVPSGGMITIKESGTLYMVAGKNGYYSEEAVYAYTIQPAFGGGGIVIGGGGFGPMAPSGSPLDAGDDPSVIATDKAKLLRELEGTNAVVAIDASEHAGQTVKVQLDAEVLKRAAELNKPVQLVRGGVTLTLVPGFLPADPAGTVELRITGMENGAVFAGGNRLGSVYDFTLTADGRAVSAFAKPIEVAFSVNPADVKRKHQVNVFTLNESTGEWEYVGGKWNADSTALSVDLSHFSKYAVIESNKSFADLASHWARTEIETLAARQIVNGMTATTFEPSGSVTRGQMAALLARMLRLDQSGTSTGFSDVKPSAWYAGAIRAAKEAKLVNGMTDGTFAPNADMTREQLAIVAVQAYQHASGRSPEEIVMTQEVKFADEGEISAWARHQVRLADALGIMTGLEGGEFRPQAVVTRSEAAMVLYRLMELAAA